MRGIHQRGVLPLVARDLRAGDEELRLAARRERAEGYLRHGTDEERVRIPGRLRRSALHSVITFVLAVAALLFWRHTLLAGEVIFAGVWLVREGLAFVGHATDIAAIRVVLRDLGAPLGARWTLLQWAVLAVGLAVGATGPLAIALMIFG